MSEHLDNTEPGNMQKFFSLACRILSDINGCPRMCIENVDIPGCEEDENNCNKLDQWECWQKFIKHAVKSEHVCRVCGCTENNACPPDGCCWVEEDLCSACTEKGKES